jgi:hypothetical protein
MELDRRPNVPKKVRNARRKLASAAAPVNRARARLPTRELGVARPELRSQLLTGTLEPATDQLLYRAPDRSRKSALAAEGRKPYLL